MKDPQLKCKHHYPVTLYVNGVIICNYHFQITRAKRRVKFQYLVF
jgi:hypothetical protein